MLYNIIYPDILIVTCIRITWNRRNKIVIYRLLCFTIYITFKCDEQIFCTGMYTVHMHEILHIKREYISIYLFIYVHIYTHTPTMAIMTCTAFKLVSTWLLFSFSQTSYYFLNHPAYLQSCLLFIFAFYHFFKNNYQQAQNSQPRPYLIFPLSYSYIYNVYTRILCITMRQKGISE